MSAKQLVGIALGVVVLLLLWGASELLSRRSDSTAGDLRLPAPAMNDVDTIAITHAADSVLLVRHSPTSWTVNGFAAAQAAVGDLFQALHDSVKPELAAQSPGSFARMGVDSAGGRWLRVVGGGRTLARLIVGGRGPDYDASYVRLPGDPRVYVWHGRLPTLAARRVDDWRDRVIGAVPPESVVAVEVQRGKQRYAIHRNAAKWTLAGGAPADSAGVAQLLARLRSVSASGFASPRQADSLRFDRPQRRVTARGTTGELLALAFDSTAGGFWVRRPRGGTVYRLDLWQVDQLTPTADALKHK